MSTLTALSASARVCLFTCLSVRRCANVRLCVCLLVFVWPAGCTCARAVHWSVCACACFCLSGTALYIQTQVDRHTPRSAGRHADTHQFRQKVCARVAAFCVCVFACQCVRVSLYLSGVQSVCLSMCCCVCAPACVQCLCVCVQCLHVCTSARL